MSVFLSHPVVIPPATMTNNPFVKKFRKIPHVKSSTTVGPLIGKHHKEKISIKARLRKLLHLGLRFRPKDLHVSKSLIQVAIVDPEPADRPAFDLCGQMITSGNVNLSTERSGREEQDLPESNVDPLGEALAQAFVAYQRVQILAKNVNPDVLRDRVNEEPRLIAVDLPIDPIPESSRDQGLTKLAATHPIPQRPGKMVAVRVTASSEHESEELQDKIESGTTPSGSPPEAKDGGTSPPRRHMVDANGDDVLEGHPHLSAFRHATLVDSILSTGRPPPKLKDSNAEIDETEDSSDFINAAEADKVSTPKIDANDVFWNPKKRDVLARTGVGKPSGGLWEKLAAAKYGVKISSDPDFTPEYELLSADQVQATRTELQNSLNEDDEARLLLRRLASKFNTPDEKKLKSPDQTQFQDSGYVSPPKPDEQTPTDLRSSNVNKRLVPPKTPTKIEPATTAENLSLALVPSISSRMSVESLSSNETETLTIEFANRTIEYLGLGLDYMVKQSNMELDAQRSNRARAYTDQIVVSISDILSRVALMRPHVQGTPAVTRTREFEAPAAAIEVDDHILLNCPEAEKGCVLRIGAGKDGRVVYYLNLLIPVCGFDDRMEELTIVSQMDVTSVVNQLALQEYNSRPKATKSSKPLTIEPDNWLEQAFDIKGILKRALTDTDEDVTEKSLGPPSRQIRRLLAFFLKLGSEHQECVVIAGKKPPGWEDIHWQTYWVTRDVRENEYDENLMYEKSIDEGMWSQIQYKLDENWESFVWRDTISWGKDGEQRRAYFIPMADRWKIGEEEREKWWLMFMSDFDEDAWAKERFV